MSTIDRLIKAESGGNPRARNPNSSAYGSGQFLKGTWLDMIRKHRPDLAQGNSEAAILEMRANPQLSRAMTEAYANQNSSFLQGKGYQATPGNVHLAHFAGPGGAYKVLSGDPNQTVLATLGADAVQANPFLKGMTNAGLIDWANRKQGGKGTQKTGESRTSVQSPEQKTAMSRTGFNPSDIKAGDDLTTSAQKIASTSGNALGALGGTLLAALGANQKSEAEAAQMAAGQETAQALQGATQGLEMADRLIASKDPAMRNAGIQMKAKILSAIPKDSRTSGQKDFEKAVSQGYKGSFIDFLNRKSGGTDVTTSKDYNVVRDEAGNVVRMEPIPGSPAERAMKDEEAKKAAKSRVTLRAAQTVFDDVARAEKILMDSGSFAAGPGGVLADIPIIGGSTEAGRLRALIDSVKGNVGIDSLIEIKSSGAGLGQIPQSQLEMLGSLLGKLDVSMKPSDLLWNMRRIGDIYKDIVKTEGGNPSELYKDRLKQLQGKESTVLDKETRAKGKKMAAPQVGTIVDGMRFKGGNPRLESSWEFVGQKFAGGRSPTRNITNDPDVQNLQNYANPNSIDEMRRRSAAAQEWFRAQGGR